MEPLTMTGSSRSLANKFPSYLLHKPSERARVRIDGKDFYLGPFGSDESRRRYGELIAEHASGTRVDPLKSPVGESSFTIKKLCLAFLLHAEKHFRKSD
jgi:hypothetical protein